MPKIKGEGVVYQKGREEGVVVSKTKGKGVVDRMGSSLVEGVVSPDKTFELFVSCFEVSFGEVISFRFVDHDHGIALRCAHWVRRGWGTTGVLAGKVC